MLAPLERPKGLPMSVFRNMVAGTMLAAALAMAGCGGNSVATATGANPDNEQSFQDAMVSYSACMRENGVDMPDPTFDGNGASVIMRSDATTSAGAAAPVGGHDDETFKAAAEACQPIMDAVAQDMPKPSPEEEAEMRDNALKFAQCMREHGVDMPDPTFDAAGTSSVIIKGEGDDDSGPPVDVDKFNEAASACQAEGLGGGFSVSSVDGGTGARVGIAGGSTK